ncbi:MAG: hypothetical protein R6U96_13125 [Promethearchaeia archaeon]
MTLEIKLLKQWLQKRISGCKETIEELSVLEDSYLASLEVLIIRKEAFEEVLRRIEGEDD